MAVEHGNTGWIPEAGLTWQIMISISQGIMFHCILVLRVVLRSSVVCDLIVQLLQQGITVLQVTCPGMKVQDTHEDIFVVGQVGHRLDIINMGML